LHSFSNVKTVAMSGNPASLMMVNPSSVALMTITTPLFSDQETFSSSYRVGHGLSKGGFGIVYACIRLRDGPPVTIKHEPKSSVTAWGQVSFSLLFFSH